MIMMYICIYVYTRKTYITKTSNVLSTRVVHAPRHVSRMAQAACWDHCRSFLLQNGASPSSGANQPVPLSRDNHCATHFNAADVQGRAAPALRPMRSCCLWRRCLCTSEPGTVGAPWSQLLKITLLGAAHPCSSFLEDKILVTQWPEPWLAVRNDLAGQLSWTADAQHEPRLIPAAPASENTARQSQRFPDSFTPWIRPLPWQTNGSKARNGRCRCWQRRTVPLGHE